MGLYGLIFFPEIPLVTVWIQIVTVSLDLDLNCLKVISRPLNGKRNKLAFTVFILLTFPKHQSHLQRTLLSFVSPTQW